MSLGCELDLKKINFRTRNSEYNPQRFSGVVMRILEPRTTALIFKSGKVVCTGARNEQASSLATRKFARIVQRIGFPVSLNEQKSNVDFDFYYPLLKYFFIPYVHLG